MRPAFHETTSKKYELPSRDNGLRQMRWNFQHEPIPNNCHANFHPVRVTAHEMFALNFLLLLLLTISPLIAQAAEYDPNLDRSLAVYRIRATGSGWVSDGSAVLVAAGRLLTACHTIRQAESITAGRSELEWPAHPISVDVEHDLCVLAVPQLLAAKPVVVGPTQQMRLGDRVIAAGYPGGGRLQITHGEIKGLHAHEGALVLQTSAAFSHGQSGGGIFDDAGRLIGIIGFKALAGGNFQYGLPLAWAGDAIPGQTSASIPPDFHDLAFWERPSEARPLFLRAASLEANRNWKQLVGVAQQWVKADETNPASWLCLGRTMTRLKRGQAAARAFARAAALEPSLVGTPDLPPLPAVDAASLPLATYRSDRQ